jgi:hypothetical protein
VKVSALYVCPVRGVADLRPPDPKRLGQAAAVAKNLGLDRLYIPVLEEALFLASREKVAFLDGLVQSLDRADAGGLEVSLVLPAQKLLGLRWVIPDLARPVTDPDAGHVFVAGQVRKLRPYDWWSDPSIIQKRLRAFSEALRAVAGHPGLKGLIVMDRALEWPRPGVEPALLVLKSLLAEIQERQMRGGRVGMGLGWEGLLEPQLAESLSREVDFLRIGGTEQPPKGPGAPAHLAEEIQLAAFTGSLGCWLFDRPAEAETGWCSAGEVGEDPAESCERFGAQGLEGASWLTLVDPEPSLRNVPPWLLRPELGRAGLLDHHLDPKPRVEEWIKRIKEAEPDGRAYDFIDISREEYLEDPGMHVHRLWNHFGDAR